MVPIIWIPCPKLLNLFRQFFDKLLMNRFCSLLAGKICSLMDTSFCTLRQQIHKIAPCFFLLINGVRYFIGNYGSFQKSLLG